MFRAIWPGALGLLVAACGTAGGNEPQGNGGSSGNTAAGGAGGSSAGAAGAGAAGTGGTASIPGGAAGVSGSGGAGTGGAETGGSSGAGTGGSGGGELPDGVSDLFPRPGAQGVCPDPSLRLSFSGAPTVGNSGKVSVFDAAAPGQPVATVDFSATSSIDTIGGQAFNLPRQVYVDGNDVVVNLKSRALGYGKTYYVTVSAGAIVRPGNTPFSLSDASAWRFDTAKAAPSSLGALRVALDGTGNFCSPQGAIDALPANNAARVTITLEPGTYRGVVYFSGKHDITLRGADRKRVILSGTNNNNLNPSTRGRALVGADNANGLIVEQLTIQNLTPQGGSQAEALRLQNCDQCVVRNADITSLQDTLLWSGRLYAKDCYIAGNVDFIWGTGVAYFDNCEIKTVGRSGYNVQARNGSGGYGYVFVDSRITSDPGITGTTLGRIDVSAYPGSHVAYIDCTLGSHISSAGWTITGGSPTAALRFWEYGSKDAAGNSISTSGRSAGSTQISAQQAASMRDKATVLRGWVPPP